MLLNTVYASPAGCELFARGYETGLSFTPNLRDSYFVNITYEITWLLYYPTIIAHLPSESRHF